MIALHQPQSILVVTTAIPSRTIFRFRSASSYFEVSLLFSSVMIAHVLRSYQPHRSKPFTTNIPAPGSRGTRADHSDCGGFLLFSTAEGALPTFGPDNGYVKGLLRECGHRRLNSIICPPRGCQCNSTLTRVVTLLSSETPNKTLDFAGAHSHLAGCNIGDSRWRGRISAVSVCPKWRPG